MKVKSKVTHFTGIIMDRGMGAKGQNIYFLTSISPPDGYWYDEAELEIIEKAVLPSKNNDLGNF